MEHSWLLYVHLLWYLIQHVVELPADGLGNSQILRGHLADVLESDLCYVSLFDVILTDIYRLLGLVPMLTRSNWNMRIEKCLTLICLGTYTYRMCDVTGERKPKSARLLTPILFNSLWLSWVALTVLQAGIWAAVAGRNACAFDVLVNRSFNILTWFSTHREGGMNADPELWNEVLINNTHVNYYLTRLASHIQGWGATWAILGTGLLIVSFFRKAASIVCDEDGRVFSWHNLSLIQAELTRMTALLCHSSKHQANGWTILTQARCRWIFLSSGPGPSDVERVSKRATWALNTTRSYTVDLFPPCSGSWWKVNVLTDMR